MPEPLPTAALRAAASRRRLLTRLGRPADEDGFRRQGSPAWTRRRIPAVFWNAGGGWWTGGSAGRSLWRSWPMPALDGRSACRISPFEGRMSYWVHRKLFPFSSDPVRIECRIGVLPTGRPAVPRPRALCDRRGIRRCLVAGFRIPGMRLLAGPGTAQADEGRPPWPD